MDYINKIGAIIIDNKRILVCKKKDKYIIPGGRIEKGESDEECLRRELKEELDVGLISFNYFDSFEDEAALDPGMIIEMKVYFVKIEGIPKARSEIENIKWIDSGDIGKMKLGSIIEKFVMPILKERNMIN